MLAPRKDIEWVNGHYGFEIINDAVQITSACHVAAPDAVLIPSTACRPEERRSDQSNLRAVRYRSTGHPVAGIANIAVGEPRPAPAERSCHCLVVCAGRFGYLNVADLRVRPHEAAHPDTVAPDVDALAS